MKSGREREVKTIVTHDRAVEVANLLLGELDRPMRRIAPEDYLALPRNQLRSGKISLQDGRKNKLREFCQLNFGISDISRLANLYEKLFACGSQLRLPLKEFAELIGLPQEGVLKGAPRHSTIAISPWGLQSEYPEMHLVRDIAVSLNSAMVLDAEIHEQEGTPWVKAKQESTKRHLAELHTRASFYRRMCLLSCFNLVEAYINGIAWEFVDTHDISNLSKNKQDLLASGQSSILEKLVKVPEIIAGKNPGPLVQEKDPLKTFKEIIKPFRDSIVHASPFSAPARFGGYEKLSKVYELTLATASTTADLTIEIIGLVHRFLGGKGEFPQWLLLRNATGKFELSTTS